LADRKFETLLGGGLSTLGWKTEFSLDGSYVRDTWYWNHSLNFLAAGEYELAPAQRLTIGIGSPLIRSVVRPDFSLSKRYDDDPSYFKVATYGATEFFWENLVLMFNLGYQRPVGKRFDLRASYHFVYAASDEPHDMGMYMNNFLLGLHWRF
jgi:hypothetical protein